MSGLDFEGIGAAMAMGREIGHARRAAFVWQDRADRLERELARTRAELAAHEAGRRAQLAALRRAMETVAPFDPVMRRTGRTYDCGDAERQWEAAYGDAYDAVAAREGLPPARRPMTPAARAAAAEVLAEPVVETRFLWWRRYHWRGQEHRTRAGAERARERAAREARAALEANRR